MTKSPFKMMQSFDTTKPNFVFQFINISFDWHSFKQEEFRMNIYGYTSNLSQLKFIKTESLYSRRKTNNENTCRTAQVFRATSKSLNYFTSTIIWQTVFRHDYKYLTRM